MAVLCFSLRAHSLGGHIPHGCCTITSPCLWSLLCSSHDPCFGWTTSPRVGSALFAMLLVLLPSCWADQSVDLARRYSPKERASYGGAGVDNVPRVKVSQICSTLSQVLDRHHIPQTKGHSWLFENLASMLPSGWRTRWVRLPWAACMLPAPFMKSTQHRRSTLKRDHTLRVNLQGREEGVRVRVAATASETEWWLVNSWPVSLASHHLLARTWSRTHGSQLDASS